MLVSPNIMDTLNNAEQFMGLKEYRTAAALFTVARQRLGDPASPQLVATLLCKRAECLLQMVSIVVSCIKHILGIFLYQLSKKHVLLQ